MRRRYVTVLVVQDVDVPIEDILDGMGVDDLAELAEAIDAKLKSRAPATSQPFALADAVMRRHCDEHDGPLWMCSDAVCSAHVGAPS